MQMNRVRRIVIALVAMILLLVQVSAAAPNAGRGNAPEFERYLVGLKPGVAAAALEAADVQVMFNWPQLNAMAVKATPGAYNRLMNDPRVEYVEEDVLRYPSSEITWGLDAVNAPEAWASATGTGAKVCVIDSGIDYGHPEFFRDGVSIIKGSKNFNGDGQADAQDGLGHGTHVAGTVAAALNGTGVAGVAYGVDLYIARIFDNAGGGAFTSVIVNAVNWCSDTVQAHVFNMSFGSSVSNRTEKAAMDKAYNNGRLLVAASGNSGTNRIGYPAAYASVVAVGALNRDLTLASFSQYGKEQEVTAPGVGVLSTVPRGMGLLGTASEQGVSYEAYALEYSGTGNILDKPLVECGLAGTTSSCTGIPSGSQWIAMIDRGTYSFADKVTNVMAQGASAAIIANNDTVQPNDPGNFTLGSAGSWIPSVSVSYNSGLSIRTGGLGNGSVTVGAADYDYYDGTSMASPHAAAVAALAWSANLSLKNTDIRQILRDTAFDLGPGGWDQQYGYGLVQADAAVAAAIAMGGGGGGGGGGTNGTMNVAVNAGGPYKAGDFVYITVTATDASTGAALSGASVNLTILNPNGTTAATGSGTTDSAGQITFKWKSAKNGAKGTYTANATVTLSGYDTGTGSTTFEIN